MRAHLYLTITDNQGNVQTGVGVRILEQTTLAADGTPNPDVPLAATLYSGPDPAHSTVVGDQFVSDTGVLDLWLDSPQYVKVGITPVAGAEWFIDGLPVLAPGGGGGGPRGGVQAYAWGAICNVPQASSGGQARPSDGWDLVQIGPAGLPEVTSVTTNQFVTQAVDPTYGWSGSALEAALHIGTPGWFEVRVGIEAKFLSGAPDHADLYVAYPNQPSQSGTFRLFTPSNAQGVIWFDAGILYLDGNLAFSLAWPGAIEVNPPQFMVELVGL